MGQTPGQRGWRHLVTVLSLGLVFVVVCVVVNSWPVVSYVMIALVISEFIDIYS